VIERDGRLYASTREILDQHLLGVDVTADNLRDWVRRGLTTPLGRTANGNLFDLDELVEVEHQMRTSRRGKRRAA
jgi:DNA-binding transcriptional MerR regulator